jgi:hypothetical protein
MSGDEEEPVMGVAKKAKHEAKAAKSKTKKGLSTRARKSRMLRSIDHARVLKRI